MALENTGLDRIMDCGFNNRELSNKLFRFAILSLLLFGNRSVVQTFFFFLANASVELQIREGLAWIQINLTSLQHRGTVHVYTVHCVYTSTCHVFSLWVMSVGAPVFQYRYTCTDCTRVYTCTVAAMAIHMLYGSRVRTRVRTRVQYT